MVVATWPAELAPQARFLYGEGLGSALVAAAIERGRIVEPSPHIAFRTSSPSRRLYMSPSIAPLCYVARWEDKACLVGPAVDLSFVGLLTGMRFLSLHG